MKLVKVNVNGEIKMGGLEIFEPIEAVLAGIGRTMSDATDVDALSKTACNLTDSTPVPPRADLTSR